MIDYIYSKPFLVMDCQTTGMHPKQSHLIEIAWSVWRMKGESSTITHHFVKLPEGENIPRRISQMTGITDLDLNHGLTPFMICNNLSSMMNAMGNSAVAISHYAIFEKSFLRHLFLKHLGDETLPFNMLCSQKISKKIFPNLPSYTLKGILGYLGFTIEETKKAKTHVEATIKIIGVLFEHLSRENITSLEDLVEWVNCPAAPQVKKYEYKIDRVKRLEISTKPGIYKMISADGSILYIGKATSLRNRVNSYFRGQKNRDRRILEMLSQVVNIDTTECDSALEAALLEADEIKRLSPPYNITLKNATRELLFYSCDFHSFSYEQNETFPIGPFRPNDAINNLKLLHHWLKTDEVDEFVETMFPATVSREGVRLFCEAYSLNVIWLCNTSFRSFMCLGLIMLRNLEKINPTHNFEKEWAKIKKELLIQNPKALEFEFLTPNLIKERIERLFLRAAHLKRRTRQLTRLLNSSIQIKHGDINKLLKFNNGKLNDDTLKKTYPWSEANIALWDRMSILLAHKKSYTII
jgi:DNA polymerase-3 subunit epsilon